MPRNTPSTTIRQFLGIQNRQRNVQLPNGALADAVNINLDNQGGAESRRGYAAIAGLSGITAFYARRDGAHGYVVAAGNLKRIVSASPLVTVLLATGIGSGRVWWTESGSTVIANGAVRTMLLGDTLISMEDGRAPPAPANEFDSGRSYSLAGHPGALYAMPAAVEPICLHMGKLYGGEYMSSADQSVIWFSKPFLWTLFDYSRDYFLVPGRVLLLATTGQGPLIVGTDRAIYAYGDGLGQLADYGVVPGDAVYSGSGRSMVAYFWTQEGLCRAAPFENVTFETFSGVDGEAVALGAVSAEGSDRVVVSVRGGAAVNPYE